MKTVKNDRTSHVFTYKCPKLYFEPFQALLLVTYPIIHPQDLKSKHFPFQGLLQHMICIYQVIPGASQKNPDLVTNSGPIPDHFRHLGPDPDQVRNSGPYWSHCFVETIFCHFPHLFYFYCRIKDKPKISRFYETMFSDGKSCPSIRSGRRNPNYTQAMPSGTY